MKKMNEKKMEMINGGMVVMAQGLPEYDPTCPWEVVDNNTGAMLGKFPMECEACQFGESYGKDNSYNAQEVDVPTVLRLRGVPTLYC